MRGTAGNGPRFAGASIGIAVFLTAVVIAAAAPLPNEARSRLDFRIAPSKLSRTEPKPARMSIEWEDTEDGHPLEPLRALRFEGDRDIRLDLEGVPVCERPLLDVRRDLAEMEEFCGDAAIGRGELVVTLHFPGDRLIAAEAKMTIYKVGHGPDLLAFVELPAPIAGTLGIPIDLRRVQRGRMGWEARAPLPKIAGGSGVITRYSLRIGKRFLTATCADGRLDLRAVTAFADGEKRGERVIRPCSVAKADAKRRIRPRPTADTDRDVEMVFNAGLAPSKVPREKPVPASLTFSARFSTPEGGVPPLRQLVLESEAELAAGFAGIPVCPARRIPAIRADERKCPGAVVGAGLANVSVPGDGSRKPDDLRGTSLVAYNGGRVNGRRVLWLRIGEHQTGSPTMARIIVEPIDEAPYRLRLRALIPAVPALEGGVRTFNLTLNRQPVVATACPRRRFRFRGTAVLANGARPSAEISQSCSISGS